MGMTKNYDIEFDPHDWAYRGRNEEAKKETFNPRSVHKNSYYRNFYSKIEDKEKDNLFKDSFDHGDQ